MKRSFAASLTQAAKGDLPNFVRQTLAKAVGYVGALKAGRKYATPEERKNAAADRRKKKADLMKRLYKEHQDFKPCRSSESTCS